VGNISSGNAGPLIAVIAVGICVGFLPHNFYPAKIFMGDSGAMLLGVLVAASTLSVVGQDPYEFSGRTYFFFAPIIIPFFILGIPMLDTVFAVVRRAGQRTSPAVADLNHLHHRLMRLGHGHRAAVIILWAWTALLSGLVLWPGVTNSHNEIPPIAVGALSILLYTLFAPRGRATGGSSDNERGPGQGAAAGTANGNGAPAKRPTWTSRHAVVASKPGVVGTSQPGVVGAGPNGVGTGEPAVGTNGHRAGPRAVPTASPAPAPVVAPRVRVIPPGDPAEHSEHTLGGL
jgi:hypothetical protein